MPADRLHAWMVELLKANRTYHLGYRAAFRWDALARIALLRHPVQIIAAHDDPLADDSMDLAARLAIDANRLPRSDDPAFPGLRAAAILGFFAAI